jgi:hypothetical protein
MPWQQEKFFVKELGLIVIIKLIVLYGIWHFCFKPNPRPVDPAMLFTKKIEIAHDQ